MPVGAAGAPNVGGVAPAAPQSDDAAAKALISRARKPFHEGYNNDNPFTQRVIGDRHQPWCAAYVSCMLKDANIPGISGRMWSAGVSGLMGQFQQAGRLFRSGSIPPQPGDVIFFGTHHTGIVQKVEGNKVYTIEGNSGDQVSERSYDLNNRSISGYGRVFGGQVSPDLGFQPNTAYQGSSEGRATGRGTANTAQANGIEPTQYFNNNQNWLIALLRAMSGDDPANVAAALEQMFPQVSKEDLADVAKVLKANPKLATKIAAHPELLQELVANHSAAGVKHLLRTKMTEADKATAAEVMKQVNPPPMRGGWGPTPTQLASNAGWKPPVPDSEAV